MGKAAEQWRVVWVAEDRPPYLDMTRLSLWSLRTRGGALANAPATVVFNDSVRDDTRAWFEARGAVVEVRPRIQGIPSTSLKFNALLSPSLEKADWLLYLDCDTVVSSDLGPLAEAMRQRRAEDGVGFASTPTNMKQAWRMDEILARYTGRPAESFDHLKHPWFLEGWSVFNTGVFVLEARHAATLHQEIVPLCTELLKRGRSVGDGPWWWVKTKWNRKVFKKPWGDRLVLAPWYPKNHAGQIAMPIALARLGISHEVLPHAYNWRQPGTNQGEDDIRILHYCGSRRFLFDRSELLTGTWRPVFAGSADPGERTLAAAVEAFLADA